MTEIAVTNSTVLIALERIDRINILKQSFRDIYIPPKVSQEFNLNLNWLKV